MGLLAAGVGRSATTTIGLLWGLVVRTAAIGLKVGSAVVVVVGAGGE